MFFQSPPGIPFSQPAFPLEVCIPHPSLKACSQCIVALEPSQTGHLVWISVSLFVFRYFLRTDSSGELWYCLKHPRRVREMRCHVIWLCGWLTRLAKMMHCNKWNVVNTHNNLLPQQLSSSMWQCLYPWDFFGIEVDSSNQLAVLESSCWRSRGGRKEHILHPKTRLTTWSWRITGHQPCTTKRISP